MVSSRSSRPTIPGRGRMLLGDTASDELLAAIKIRTPAFLRSARPRRMLRDLVLIAVSAGRVRHMLPRELSSVASRLLTVARRPAAVELPGSAANRRGRRRVSASTRSTQPALVLGLAERRSRLTPGRARCGSPSCVDCCSPGRIQQPEARDESGGGSPMRSPRLGLVTAGFAWPAQPRDMEIPPASLVTTGLAVWRLNPDDSLLEAP